MKCLTEPAGIDPRGKHLHRCLVCGKTVGYRNPAGGSAQCGIVAPASGPGTELRRIFRELGIKPKPGCGCRELEAAMNALGVDGCRRERDKLLARLKAGAAKFGWTEHAIAALRAVALPIDWRDPLGSLLTLAIDRTIPA